MTIPWTITGTANQQAILRQAFDRIKFPFDRLTLPGKPEMGWRDLNSRAHGTHTHGAPGEDKPDSLTRMVDGRKYTMAVIYTMSGRIYIERELENHPDLAMACVGAEIAHAVDFFMPMTDAQRNELLRLWGKGGTWWEVSDYGSEYFRLGGEAFMGEFVAAYSDLPFERSDFLHDAGVEPVDVRRVLGLERTDYVAPAPVPTGVGVTYGRSKVYHKPTHKVRTKHAATHVYVTAGLTRCRTCKP